MASSTGEKVNALKSATGLFSYLKLSQDAEDVCSKITVVAGTKLAKISLTSTDLRGGLRPLLTIISRHFKVPPRFTAFSFQVSKSTSGYLSEVTEPAELVTFQNRIFFIFFTSEVREYDKFYQKVK